MFQCEASQISEVNFRIEFRQITSVKKGEKLIFPLNDVNDDPSNLDTYVFKIVIIGDGKVGKTSLRKRYMGEGFSREYLQTLKADFAYYREEFDNFTVKWSIWDLAGQPEYDNVRRLYFAGADGALVCFDVTRPETFRNLDNWIDQLESSTETEGAPIYLVGNKIDLCDETDCVDFDQVESYQDSLISRFEGKFDVDYIKTSALTGENVREAFTNLGKSIYNWKMNL